MGFAQGCPAGGIASVLLKNIFFFRDAIGLTVAGRTGN